MFKHNIIFPKQIPDHITSEQLNQLAHLIEGGRQVFGQAGASLTWGIDGQDGGEVAAGLEGEKMTAKILQQWLATNPQALLFHSVRWPQSEGDTDHMLVIGRHVLLIDSKRWKAKRKYSLTAKGAVKRGTVDFPEGNVKMIPAMSSWRKILPAGTRVAGTVCIAQEEVFVPYDENWRKSPYKLVTVEKLPDSLDYFANKASKDGTEVNLSIVSHIVMGLVKPRDRRS